MAESRLLKRVRLLPAHQPTGRTKHYHGNQLVPVPVELRIVQYNSDPGFYLLYCDDSGSEMADTYHASIQAAMAQANWEFNVEDRNWEEIEADLK